MKNRLARTVFAFCAVYAAYSVYSWTVVPLVEPNLAARKRTVSQATPSVDTDVFRSGLARLFPADSWELTSSKVLRNDKSCLLFQDYKTKEDGSVIIQPCTVVVYSEPPTPGAPPQTPIILQAPAGAVLYFDQPLDLRTATVGEPVASQLLGQVRIHCDGDAQGKGRLELMAQNINIDKEEIWTTNHVQFRYERSHGSGTHLVIKLRDTSDAIKNKDGISAIDRIDLVKLDSLHFDFQKGSLFDDRPDSQNRDAKGTSDRGPVDVRCAGPLEMDLLRHSIRLSRNVQLAQANSLGGFDTIDCEELLIRYADAESVPAATVGPNPDQSMRQDGLRLERVIAKGNPVRIQAPSRQAILEGQRLEYEAASQKFRMQSTTVASLQYQGKHDFRALEFEFTPGQPGQLGELVAVGPGRYQGVASSAKDVTRPSPVAANRDDGAESTVVASWEGQVRFYPREGLQWLDANQRVSLQMEGQGKIDAEKLRVCFEPNPTTAASEQNDWRPKWVQAQNDVRFHSEQLDGETDQLLVRFEYPNIPAAQATDEHGVRPVSTFPYRVTSEGEHSVSTVANGSRSEFTSRTNPLGRSQVGGNRLPSSGTNAAPWQLFLAGDELDITVRVLSPGPSELVRVDVTGNASLDRIDAGAQTEPFRLNAQRFTLTNATSTGGVFTAFGQPARIRFQDMQVAGNQMEVDRNRNLIRINGAGTMDMTGTPQLGKSSSGTRAQPNNGDLANEKTHIQWRDGFVFDGRVARVEGKVTLENSKEQIRADRVNIHLKNPIDLGQTDSNTKAEVDNVLAEGSVRAEHRIIEDNDLRTVAIFMCPSFQLNQQTGDFLAMGDGLVMAWRKGFQAGSALGAQGQSKEDPDRISFVQIEFGRQGTGNVNQRSVTFDQQVRLTYGPVRKFYDRIRPGLPLTDDDVILMCDQMTLMQVASNASGGMAVDARARGNTTIRGAWFKATGERASYDQSKGLFVLEGEGQTPARVEAQKRSSRTSTETVGQKILVWPATKEVELDDVRFLDLRTFSRLGAGR